MQLDSLNTMKRSRSVSSASSDDAGSGDGSQEAWSDLDDDNWLSRPERSDLEPGPSGSGLSGRYARAVTPQKITSLTPLGIDNVGMKMLKLMGWQPGGGLGARGTGRTEPIPLPDKMDSMGLGRANIETRMLDQAITRRPKLLESQKIANETEEQRIVREAIIANKAGVTATIQETLAKFHCHICSKGYANVGQWEEHQQSYGHNHAKRKYELAMQSRSNKNSADELTRRREKEKKKEQKELERMVRAAGGAPQSGPSSGTSALSGSVGKLPPAPGGTPGESSIALMPEKKKVGFFKVAGSSAPPPPSAQPAPPPPPPADPGPNIPPPPPPSTSRMSAPKFASSTESSLAATWKPSTAPALHPSLQSVQPMSNLAGLWKPSAAPDLHPLLAASTPPSFSVKPAKEARKDRNDFFASRADQDERSSRPFELPTSASSIGTQRASKGMAFVASSSSSSAKPASTSNTNIASPAMSLASKVAPKKKALDMDADDEDGDEGAAMSLPTGRPKAVQKGKIGFGFGKLG